MFAVIKTGGKQYKVAKDDIVVVEKLAAEVGASLTLQPVLMLGGDGAVQVGAPAVDGASVAAEVVEQTRGAKVRVFKKKRRKNYRRMRGHRQEQTVLRITDILTDGKKPAKKAETAEETPAAKKKPGARTQQKAAGQRGKAEATTTGKAGAGGSKGESATAKKSAAEGKAKAGAGTTRARQTGTKKQAAAKPAKQRSTGKAKSPGKSASKGGSTSGKKS